MVRVTESGMNRKSCMGSTIMKTFHIYYAYGFWENCKTSFVPHLDSQKSPSWPHNLSHRLTFSKPVKNHIEWTSKAEIRNFRKLGFLSADQSCTGQSQNSDLLQRGTLWQLQILSKQTLISASDNHFLKKECHTLIHLIPKWAKRCFRVMGIICSWDVGQTIGSVFLQMTFS